MKKKILAFILAIGMCFSFAGCSLVSENATRYADEVVARVGDEVITRNEISSLYNSYASVYGSSYQDTIMSTIWAQLINQKILLNEAKKKITLTPADDNEIWQKVFDYVDEQIDNLMVENGYMEKSEETDEDLTIGYGYKKTEIKEVGCLFASLAVVYSAKDYVRPTEGDRLKCFNEFVSNIVENSKANGKDTDKETAFIEYLNKAFKTYKDSEYITRYEKYLETLVAVSDEEILLEYNNLLNTQKQKYQDEDLFKTDAENLSLTDLLLYVPSNTYFTVQHILIKYSDEQIEELADMIGSNGDLDALYGEEYNNKKAEYATNLIITEYRELLTGEVKQSETGFDTYFDVLQGVYVEGDDAVLLTDIEGEKKVTVETIEALVNEIMTNLELTDKQKLAYFNELMFVYGQDPGMQNITFTEDEQITNYYYTDSSTNTTTESTSTAGKIGYILPDPDSTAYEDFAFEQPFKDKAKESYEDWENNGAYGSTSVKVALGSNGVHIILFTGFVGGTGNDGFYYEGTNGGYYLVESSANESAVTIDNLKSTFVKGYENADSAYASMTIYDYLYEKLLAEKVQNAEQEFIATKLAEYERTDGMIVKIKETYDEIFSTK